MSNSDEILPRTATRARTEQVLELLAAGLSRREIIRWAAEKTEWAVGSRTIDRLIRRAGKLFESESAPLRAREIGKSLRRLEMLFSRCLAEKDYKGALAVEARRIALLGLDAAPAAAGRPAFSQADNVIEFSPIGESADLPRERGAV